MLQLMFQCLYILIFVTATSVIVILTPILLFTSRVFTIPSSMIMKQFLLIYLLLQTVVFVSVAFIVTLTPILLFMWRVLTILSRLDCMRLSKIGKTAYLLFCK